MYQIVVSATPNPRGVRGFYVNKHPTGISGSPTLQSLQIVCCREPTMKITSVATALALSAALFAAPAAQAADASYSFGAVIGEGSNQDVLPGFVVGGTTVPQFSVGSLSTITLTWSGTALDGYAAAATNFGDLKLISYGSSGTTTVSGSFVESSGVYTAVFNNIAAGTYSFSLDADGGDSLGGAFAGTVNISAVPEPATLGLSLVGIASLFGLSRLQSKRDRA